MPQAAVTGLVLIGTALGVNLSRFSVPWSNKVKLETYCFLFSREWRQQLLWCQQNPLQIAQLKYKSTTETKSHKIKTHMGYPCPYHHDHGTTCLHCRLPIQRPSFLALDPLKSPISFGEFAAFLVPSLGLHRHTKLLLCSCHGLCDRVLNVDVHWDIINDGLDCRIRSLWELSGSEWHCRDWKDVGIQPHTFIPLGRVIWLFLDYAHFLGISAHRSAYLRTSG